MNFLNMLTKHKVVEVNRLTALLSGHMIAQAPYRQVAAETYLDNGAILFLSKNAELVLGNHADAIKGQPFLHYTEELMTFELASAYEYFTVDLEETLTQLDGTGTDLVCYPRAIALYEGDAYTSNNFVTAISPIVAGTRYFAIVDANGALSVVSSFPAATYDGPVFSATSNTLPGGQAGFTFVLLAKNLKDLVV